ncbi:VWA domain-containing protein [Chloroflexus sp.]|uniref:VWA domain-containing protein n=1 Tax=Chloroflexus sp. TaxID=1904827 RepID=UPI002ADE1D05|nr:VWA domain-containing protein [Chloroflexus sp.]
MIWQAPHMFWLLLVLPALLLIWRRAGNRLPWSVVGMRLAIVALLVGALADPIRPLAGVPLTGPLIVLYDQSDSLTPAGQAAIRAEAEAIAAAAGPKTRLLAFGADVVAGGDRLPDGAGSDLAAAITTVRHLLPGGGRVILISDGQTTGGDALIAAQQAAQAGIRIDVRLVSPPAVSEVAVTRFDVPAFVRSGETFELRIATFYRSPVSSDALAARLRIWADDQLLGEEPIFIPSGSYEFVATHTATEPGIVRLRTELVLDGNDTFAANNVAGATTLVMPPPNILLIEDSGDEGAVLADALRRSGMVIERSSASELPANLDLLTRFDGFVLVDVSAFQLSLEQMVALREVVRSEGKGLTVIGGNQSFTLGGYAETPLADALPLLMTPPPRPQRAPVSLLFIIDRSASMSATFGISKFDMAKEAAILSLAMLQPGDRVGVLAFDTETVWTVPFRTVGEGVLLAELQDQIATMSLGGGTNIERALSVGLPALANEPYSTRHAILLTDGRSYSNNYQRYQQLVESARAAQITLSTIAIGSDSDTELLNQLAAWGNGRYYYVADASDLPRITFQESEIATAELTVEQPVPVILHQPHPLVRNLNPRELPTLDGYIALQPRPEASLVLKSPVEDPLLAVWQYGLGRSVAWAASVTSPWASSWPAWSGYEQFWAQIVQYTLPTSDSGPLQVWVETANGHTRLVVDARSAGGKPIDLAQVTARTTLPNGNEQNINLIQVAPGQYARDLSFTSVGPYAITVVLFANGQTLQRSIGYVQPPPAEYAFPPPQTSQGASRLEQIATMTGGSMEVDLSATTPAARASGEVVALWPYLAGLALLLWLVEIALRRNRLLV